jgi:hypothetical protein
VFAALFSGAAWVTWQLDGYEELGDYLLRLGLSWIFMTFLAFLAFSGIVTALSTFFLSDDLRLLLTAPIAARRLFYARFARTVAQSSWMVIVFITPVLLGVGWSGVHRRVLRHLGAHHPAVCDHSGRRRHRLHALLVNVLSRPARTRSADADGLSLRRQHRRFCCG